MSPFCSIFSSKLSSKLAWQQPKQIWGPKTVGPPCYPRLQGIRGTFAVCHHPAPVPFVLTDRPCSIHPFFRSRFIQRRKRGLETITLLLYNASPQKSDCHIRFSSATTSKMHKRRPSFKVERSSSQSLDLHHLSFSPALFSFAFFKPLRGLWFFLHFINQLPTSVLIFISTPVTF